MAFQVWRNALGPWMRGDSSGHWSKGGEEVVGDFRAWVELGNLLLGRLPVECPHPHPQPWEHHQVLEECLDDGIKLLLLAFNQRLVGRKKEATVFRCATIVRVRWGRATGDIRPANTV